VWQKNFFNRKYLVRALADVLFKKNLRIVIGSAIIHVLSLFLHREILF
jgi:hypothetical protein